MNKKLDQVAVVDLAGGTSIADMARLEGWDPDLYSIALSETIRSSGMSLDIQRERLSALAGTGAAAGQASADELARQFSILEALHHRFARAAVEAMTSGLPRASETSERYLSAALKAQRGAMACLSALKALRDAQQPPAPTMPAAIPVAVPAPATRATAT